MTCQEAADGTAAGGGGQFIPINNGSSGMNTKTLLAIAIGTTTASSDAIAIGPFAAGELTIAAGSSLTTLTWYHCASLGGTYVACVDSTGTAITSRVTNAEACSIPTSLFACAYLKAVGNVATTADVSLKG